jgi:hypothetical protein
MKNVRILIIDENPGVAERMSYILNVGLKNYCPGLITSTCTMILNPDPSKIKMPRLDVAVDMIERADVILLSDYSCSHNSDELLAYCKEKKVVTTSQRKNGYNHFPEKNSLATKNHDDTTYLDAVNNLCTLVRNIIIPSQKTTA